MKYYINTLHWFFYHFKYWIKFLFKSKNKLKSLKVLFLNIYFLVRHLGEKSILWVFSLTCWGLTGSQHISTTLTILHYLDLKVAAWVTCFRCTYFEIMLEGASVQDVNPFAYSIVYLGKNFAAAVYVRSYFYVDET